MSDTEMTGVITSEGTLTTDDGVSLYTKTWTPSSLPSKARLAFVHGFSDHANAYGIFFPYLAQQGIKVYTYDQRGWGESVKEASQRGDTGPNTRIMQDLTCFLQSLAEEEEEEEAEEEQDTPLFLGGHSMGGGIVLHYLANGPEAVKKRIRGYVLNAPFIKLFPTAMPWKSTVLLGRLASRFLPRHQLVQRNDASAMSRDKEVCKAWVSDEKCHDTGTLECLAAMLDRAADLEEGRAVVREGMGEGGKTRIWIGFGTGDRVLSYDACKKWFDKLQVDDKEFKAYEGWYHKLHSEPGDDKRIFAKDVSEWILHRTGPIDILETGARPRL